jgi:hypothetical protein
MKAGKFIDRFWAGIMLTVTVFVIIMFSGYFFGMWGEPFFNIAFNLDGLTSPLSWLQIAFVAILLGVSVAWLRRNSKSMRMM